MIASLSSCFDGSFAYWRDIYRFQDGRDGVIAASDLLDTGIAHDLVARFAAAYPGAERPAVLSLWTQWYFGSVLVPAAAALLLLDRALPVGLDETGLVFDRDGKLTAVLVGHEGAAPGPGDRFAALIEGHFAPLIAHLAGAFAVSPRLLWTNVAAILDWTIEEAGRADAPVGAAMAEGRRRLSARTDPCGRRNPMAGVVCAAEEGGVCCRRRRTCCLRYRLPGVSCCGSLCPLPAARASVLPAALH